jgi:hypothetical protein
LLFQILPRLATDGTKEGAGFQAFVACRLALAVDPGLIHPVRAAFRHRLRACGRGGGTANSIKETIRTGTAFTINVLSYLSRPPY